MTTINSIAFCCKGPISASIFCNSSFSALMLDWDCDCRGLNLASTTASSLFHCAVTTFASVTNALISPFALTKTISLILLGVVLGVLFLDVYLVRRKKIVRLSGRNLAHLIFVTMILLAVLLTTQGAIL